MYVYSPTVVCYVSSVDDLLVNSGILPLFHTFALWYGIDLSGNGMQIPFFGSLPMSFLAALRLFFAASSDTVAAERRLIHSRKPTTKMCLDF